MNIAEPQGLRNRKSKEWFAVHEMTVIKTTGYSCAPSNPTMWWCPDLGYSLSEKHHLFDTEREAIEKALTEIDAAQKLLCDKRDKLLIQLKGTPFQKRENQK